jgi:hypothetical protein
MKSLCHLIIEGFRLARQRTTSSRPPFSPRSATINPPVTSANGQPLRVDPCVLKPRLRSHHSVPEHQFGTSRPATTGHTASSCVVLSTQHQNRSRRHRITRLPHTPPSQQYRDSRTHVGHRLLASTHPPHFEAIDFFATMTTSAGATLQTDTESSSTALSHSTTTPTAVTYPP